jgi:hypothetical protein
MGKRIFTNRYSGLMSDIVAGAKAYPAVVAELQQEDIEIIGAECAIFCTLRSQNDGETYATIELSQVGKMGQDGAILAANCTEGWNTAPQGIEKAIGHVVAMFPAGVTVPIREEGYIYVNGAMFNKSAGQTSFAYDVIVYYTKGRSK